MNIIYYITLFLLLTPFFGFLTDYKNGKIKNYYIFPLIFISFFITFFISGFYNNYENIFGIIIIIFLGYLFYINNKWGAGDGKYIILIGLNSLIIGFLLGLSINVLNILLSNIFLLFFIYIIIYVLINIGKISKINIELKNNHNYIDHFQVISFLYLFSYFVSNIVTSKYSFLMIFLSIIIIIPYLFKIKNLYIKYLIILFGFIYGIYTKSYYSLAIIPILYFLFYYLQIIIEKVFDIIDIKEINVYELTQGMILNDRSIQIIKSDINIEYNESPLQGNEVFDIIGNYKKLGKNINVYIYKDLKIGILIYIGYLFTILTNI